MHEILYEDASSDLNNDKVNKNCYFQTFRIVDGRHIDIDIWRISVKTDLILLKLSQLQTNGTSKKIIDQNNFYIEDDRHSLCYMCKQTLL